MGAIAGALIAGGATIAATGGQALLTGKMNKKTRNWNNQQIERQRDWALQDYAMQNEYNSPKAQMERFKEAGLNPHLIYGNGADAQGANMAAPQAARADNQIPDIQGGISSALGAYQDATQRQLQNNLLKTQNTIAEREIQLKELERQAREIGILGARFDLDLKGELRPYNLQHRKKQVETLDQNIMESLTRMSNTTWAGNRDSMRLQSDLKTADLQREIMKISANKSRAEIDQINQNIENMKKSGQWQQLQNDLQEKMGKLNMTTADPAIFKFLSAIADKLGRK